MNKTPKKQLCTDLDKALEETQLPPNNGASKS
jgi:hypothetical protein